MGSSLPPKGRAVPRPNPSPTHPPITLIIFEEDTSCAGAWLGLNFIRGSKCPCTCAPCFPPFHFRSTPRVDPGVRVSPTTTVVHSLYVSTFTIVLGEDFNSSLCIPPYLHFFKGFPTDSYPLPPQHLVVLAIVRSEG